MSASGWNESCLRLHKMYLPDPLQQKRVSGVTRFGYGDNGDGCLNTGILPRIFIDWFVWLII